MSGKKHATENLPCPVKVFGINGGNQRIEISTIPQGRSRSLLNDAIDAAKSVYPHVLAIEVKPRRGEKRTKQ